MDNCSIALGTFDGLHKGHMAVLNRVRSEKGRPVALTFALPPRLSLKGGSPELLITPEDKKRRLAALGIQPEMMCFSQIKNLSPAQFLERLIGRFHPALIVSGFNFRFGSGARGTPDFLRAFCAERGIAYADIPPVEWENAPVSSTRIREAVKMGDMALARNMLGRHFGFESPIIHGDARGRTIGFPTVNQVYPEQLVTPRFGVYASNTVIDGVIYRSVTNIGKRPTFATDYVISETHLFDYEGDLYGKSAEILLTGFIRDETRFDSLEALKDAIARDKRTAREMDCPPSR